MATLRKRKTKSGHYSADFRYKGRRYVLSTKTKNKHVAKRIIKDIEARIALGKFDVRDYMDSCVLLKDVIINYVEEETPNKSPRTMKNEIQQLNNFAKSIPDRTISSISHQDIIPWRNKRLAEVKRITVNNECRVLRHFFNWCIKQEYIKENPLANLPKLKVEESHRLYMNSDELKSILEKIDAARLSARGTRDKRFMEHFELLVIFLLLTGLRLGEALALQWSNIDLEHGVVYVYQSKVNKSRNVPLHPVVIRILKKLGPELFKGLNGNHVSRKFRYYMLLADLRGFKLHSLRHTFASNLVQLGSSLTAVKDLLGHSDVRTTMIYAKTNIGLLQAEVNKFNIEFPNSDILVTKKGESEKKD